MEKTASADESYISMSCEFIRLVGSSKLCALGNFSRQNLTGWKKRGIPTAWKLLFKREFPEEYKQAFNE